MKNSKSYLLMLAFVIFFSLKVNCQDTCRLRSQKPLITYYSFHGRTDKSYSIVKEVLSSVNKKNHFYWNIDFEPSRKEMYIIGKVYTKNVIEDFDLFFEINEFKKAKQAVYTGFSNGCRGLDFEFYEIHFANEEIAQNIEKLFQIKNNDMENTKSKSVFIRNKNRIYSLSYFWGSTLDKDVYNDSNIVFEELKKAIKEFSNVKF